CHPRAAQQREVVGTRSSVLSRCWASHAESSKPEHSRQGPEVSDRPERHRTGGESNARSLADRRVRLERLLHIPPTQVLMPLLPERCPLRLVGGLRTMYISLRLCCGREASRPAGRTDQDLH